MITLSVCMIVKNEEDVLARCLNCVKQFADEIVIVDTGSSDNTKEIAKEFTKHVYDFAWIDDFSAARNFAFSKATGDYLMWLDADDIILSGDIEKIKELKQTLPHNTNVVMMPYHVSFDKAGNPTFTYNRERIVKNNGKNLFGGTVHEAITPTPPIVYSDAAVTHEKLKPSAADRNLKIFRSMLEKGQQFSPREQYYYARELYYNKYYKEAIYQLNTFLARKDGWVENKIEACSILSNCHKAIGEDHERCMALFQSFLYDNPRAEICCDLGAFFVAQEQYKNAIFWYETALHCTYNPNDSGFKYLDCYNYIPYIQLCVCYDKLGDYKKANDYNEKAFEIKPTENAVLLNKTYFQKKLAAEK